VATGIVLISAPTNRLMHAVRLATLVVAGLTGVVSCLLWPAFAIEYCLTRKRCRLHETIVLGLVCAIQAFCVLHLSTGRPTRCYWNILPLALLTKQWLLPLTGAETADFIGAYIQRHSLVDRPLVCLLALTPYAAVGAALARWGQRESRLLFLAGGGLATISFLVALEAQGPMIRSYISGLFGGRYFYAPNVFMALAVLTALGPSLARPAAGVQLFRRACLAFIAMLLVVGGYDYATGIRRHAYIFQGPSWSTEVKSWEEGSTDRLKIWPVSWSIELPRAKKKAD
jgi:hypothetical protein